MNLTRFRHLRRPPWCARCASRFDTPRGVRCAAKPAVTPTEVGEHRAGPCLVLSWGAVAEVILIARLARERKPEPFCSSIRRTETMPQRSGLSFRSAVVATSLSAVLGGCASTPPAARGQANPQPPASSPPAPPAQHSTQPSTTLPDPSSLELTPCSEAPPPQADQACGGSIHCNCTTMHCKDGVWAVEFWHCYPAGPPPVAPTSCPELTPDEGTACSGDRICKWSHATVSVVATCENGRWNLSKRHCKPPPSNSQFRCE